jgi:hypothetical protein
VNREELLLARARRESASARTRLTGTLVELQHRLRPKVLIEDAIDDLRDKADELTASALDAAKQRPFTAAAIVLAVVAWLFRGRLIEAVEGLMGLRATEEDD